MTNTAHSFPDIASGCAGASLEARDGSPPGLTVAGAEVVLMRFQSALFDPAAFAPAAIACPAQIANSVRRRQAEYFHGRACAQRTLAALHVFGHQVGTGAMREPLWPSGILGSITHNNSMAAAVAVPAGPCQGVGIDVESVVTDASRDAVATIAVSETESAILQGITALTPDQLLTLVFSAKESFFKAVSNVVGQYIDFDAATVTAVNAETGTLRLVVSTDLCPRLPAGTPFMAHFLFLDGATVFTSVNW